MFNKEVKSGFYMASGFWLFGMLLVVGWMALRAVQTEIK